MVKDSLSTGILTLGDKKNPQSNCWKFFQLVKFENKELEFVVCITCEKMYKTSNKTGTSKLIAHHKEHSENQTTITHYSTHKRILSKEMQDEIRLQQAKF